MKPSQQGVALLIVLLLVATVSLIAVRMTEEISYSVNRASATEDRGQAMWYARLAEELAIGYIAEQAEQTGNVDTLQEPWLAQPIPFPIDDKGRVLVHFADATDCFNLNSVVSGSADESQEDEAGLARYLLLLKTLGVDEFNADALADSLVDWIDEDDIARSGGAEDGTYGRYDVPYRTGNRPLADISELRTIKNYSAKVVEALAPFVCVHPDTKPSLININTLSLEKAEVLYAMMDDLVTVEEVRTLISERPLAGYQTVEEVLQSPIFNTIQTETFAQNIAVQSGYMSFAAKVDYGRAFVDIDILFKVDDAGKASPISRRLGEDF